MPQASDRHLLVLNTLMHQLQKAINYHVLEFDMNSAEVLGVLTHLTLEYDAAMRLDETGGANPAADGED